MKIDVGKIALVAVMIAGIQTGVLYHRMMIWNVSGIFTSPGMRTGRACRKRLQSTPIPCGIL